MDTVTQKVTTRLVNLHDLQGPAATRQQDLRRNRVSLIGGRNAKSELVENVPEVQATVVGDVWIDIHFWWEIFTNIVVTNIVITNIAVTTKYSRCY
jgi:hypothetical protein